MSNNKNKSKREIKPVKTKELRDKIIEILRPYANPEHFHDTSLSLFSRPELEDLLKNLTSDFEFKDAGYKRQEYVRGKSHKTDYASQMANYLSQYGVNMPARNSNVIAVVVNFFDKTPYNKENSETEKGSFNLIDSLDKLLTEMEEKGFTAELNTKFCHLLRGEKPHEVREIPVAKHILPRYEQLIRDQDCNPWLCDVPTDITQINYKPIQQDLSLFKVHSEKGDVLIIYDKFNEDYGVVQSLLSGKEEEKDCPSGKKYLMVDFFKQKKQYLLVKATLGKPEVVEANVQSNGTMRAFYVYEIIIKNNKVIDINYKS